MSYNLPLSWQDWIPARLLLGVALLEAGDKTKSRLWEGAAGNGIAGLVTAPFPWLEVKAPSGAVLCLIVDPAPGGRGKKEKKRLLTTIVVLYVYTNLLLCDRYIGKSSTHTTILFLGSHPFLL